MTLQELQHQALQLSIGDRWRLVQSLLSSIQQESLPPLADPVPKAPTNKPDENMLSSEKDIDYTRLRDLLAANNWKEADTETAHVIFELAKKKDPYGSLYEDMNNCPCEDLRTINQLWVDYSNGHFGFSVQKEIYQRIGVTREYDRETWQRFGYAVGWRVSDGWICQNCTWDLTAPKGHLPVMGEWQRSCDDDSRDVWEGWSSGARAWYSQVTDWHLEDVEHTQHASFSSFMSRLINCNISA